MRAAPRRRTPAPGPPRTPRRRRARPRRAGARSPGRWAAPARRRAARPSVALAQRALHVAPLLAGLDRLALVEAVLAAREGDLDLRAWAGEVDARRHEGQAALLDPADEPVDLALVGQELARAFGVVVLAAGRAVGRDVDVVQPQLAVAHLRVAVLELRRAVAQRLDLRAREHDARLELVEQVESVAR